MTTISTKFGQNLFFEGVTQGCIPDIGEYGPGEASVEFRVRVVTFTSEGESYGRTKIQADIKSVQPIPNSCSEVEIEVHEWDARFADSDRRFYLNLETGEGLISLS